LAGCVSQDSRHWQGRYPEAFIEGYTDFRAHTYDGDIGMVIFSYVLPPTQSVGDALPQLRQQIRGAAAVPLPRGELGTASGCFEILLETPTELQLQCTDGDEWRVMLDPERRKVTAMFASLDSEAERSAYSRLLQALRSAHAE